MDGDREYMPSSEYVCLVHVYAREAENLSALCKTRTVRLEELGVPPAEITSGLMIGWTRRWYWLSN